MPRAGLALEGIGQHDAMITQSTDRMHHHTDRLDSKDGEELNILMRQQEIERQAGEKACEGLLKQTLNQGLDAANEADQNQSNTLSTYLSKRRGNRAMVASGPINAKQAAIEKAERCKQELIAMQKVAKSSSRDLFGTHSQGVHHPCEPRESFRYSWEKNGDSVVRKIPPRKSAPAAPTAATIDTALGL